MLTLFRILVLVFTEVASEAMIELNDSLLSSDPLFRDDEAECTNWKLEEKDGIGGTFRYLKL